MDGDKNRNRFSHSLSLSLFVVQRVLFSCLQNDTGQEKYTLQTIELSNANFCVLAAQSEKKAPKI